MTPAVVVIGAGVAGVSAAALLATQSGGRGDVVLIERETLPAQHASGRSASVLSETSGHPAVCALARLSRPFFEDPPDGFADHPLLSARGLVWVGEADDGPALDALADAGHRLRPSVHRLDRRGVEHLLPGFDPLAIAGGGVYEPEAMSIDTAALIEGYLRMFRHAGGVTLLADEALRLTTDGAGTWTITTSGTTIHTGSVVNAAGAWVDEIGIRAGLAPIGFRALRRTAAIVPAPDHVASWPLVMDIEGRYYCEPEPGGLLVSPADETPTEPCDARPEELDVALALERVALATGLPLRSVRRAWAGLRTFAPDRSPVIGEDPRAPGFWWLAGQGGAGIKTAPAMAALLARQMRDEPLTTEESALGLRAATLSPARFFESS